MRPGLHQLADDALRIAAPVGDRAAEVDRDQLDQQRERVGERQVQVDDVAVFDDRLLLAHVDHRAVVAVGEHAALRRPGGAGGVDERVGIVGRDGGDALGHLVGVTATAALTQFVERDRVGDVAGRIDHDHRLERGQPVPHRDDLGDLARVLANDEARLGVARHPLALLRRVRGVDGDDDAAGAADAEARVRPLRPGRAQDGRPLARRQPEVDQPARDLADGLAHLAVGHLGPLVAALEHDRAAVAVLLGGERHHVRDRPRARRLRRSRT